ncbi:uncharacterized protein FSUBG_10328 [Fusarium subglutinans]|uniref:Uncharacterized protein n=1 Tax=Gibberella subglutinans TaxID=42677 RepID=A0A8H5UN02_GIBSU|nr:uncharacterized protein FSUBG_10328 [Fusarium subglutinans]KAF5592024.1 hypothetical protein FSUBG_10328 [Fusarium subglutinans]
MKVPNNCKNNRPSFEDAAASCTSLVAEPVDTLDHALRTKASLKPARTTLERLLIRLPQRAQASPSIIAATATLTQVLMIRRAPSFDPRELLGVCKKCKQQRMAKNIACKGIINGLKVLLSNGVSGVSHRDTNFSAKTKILGNSEGNEYLACLQTCYIAPKRFWRGAAEECEDDIGNGHLQCWLYHCAIVS